MAHRNLNIAPALLSDPVWSSLRRLLWYAFVHVNADVLEQLKGTRHNGLTQSQATVLRNMELDGINLKTLAERISVSKQAITPIVRELEKLGYVKLVVDENDKRSKIAHHTKKSLDFVACMTAADKVVEDNICKMIGKRRLAEIKGIIREILAS